MVEADSVGVIVAFVDGEVKVVGAVDLNVEEPWAENVSSEVDNAVRSFLAEEERALGIEDNPAALVDPEILLDERTVLRRKKAVGETDETVRGHGSMEENEGAKLAPSRWASLFYAPKLEDRDPDSAAAIRLEHCVTGERVLAAWRRIEDHAVPGSFLTYRRIGYRSSGHSAVGLELGTMNVPEQVMAIGERVSIHAHAKSTL